MPNKSTFFLQIKHQNLFKKRKKYPQKHSFLPFNEKKLKNFLLDT